MEIVITWHPLQVSPLPNIDDFDILFYRLKTGLSQEFDQTKTPRGLCPPLPLGFGPPLPLGFGLFAERPFAPFGLEKPAGRRSNKPKQRVSPFMSRIQYIGPRTLQLGAWLFPRKGSCAFAALIFGTELTCRCATTDRPDLQTACKLSDSTSTRLTSATLIALNQSDPRSLSVHVTNAINSECSI